MDVSNLVLDFFVSVIEEEKRVLFLIVAKLLYLTTLSPKSRIILIIPFKENKLCEILFQFKIKNPRRYFLFVMLALKCLIEYFTNKESGEYDRHKNVNNDNFFLLLKKSYCAC
jgi:hypothetical protein